VAIAGILFDLDNTLIDFMGMKRAASDAAARAMIAAGADFTFSQSEAGDILFGQYVENIEGNTVFEDFLREHHRQKLRLDQHAVDRITAAAVNSYLDAKRQRMQPYPGVRRTLIELVRRGLRLGVLTDAPRFKAYQRLDAAGLTDFFDFVLTTTDHGKVKPDPKPFQVALERLNMAPQECLMVGDWPERDIAGGRNVGMKTAWAKWGTTDPFADVDADFKLDAFSELLKVTAFHGTSK
jgi:HAD superfamily hydrolase (TIGR02253 family)